jgi:hypothetical protein
LTRPGPSASLARDKLRKTWEGHAAIRRFLRVSHAPVRLAGSAALRLAPPAYGFIFEALYCAIPFTQANSKSHKMNKSEKFFAITASVICVTITMLLCLNTSRDSSQSLLRQQGFVMVVIALGAFHLLSNTITYQQRVNKRLTKYTVIALQSAAISLVYWTIILIAILPMAAQTTNHPYALVCISLLVANIPLRDARNTKWLKSNLTITTSLPHPQTQTQQA